MPKIFISYRRDDSQYQADRIRGALTRILPKRDVFIDIDNIPTGVDFVDHVDKQIAQCDVLLALIGPGWIANAQRLANPKDFVRIEIASALKRGITVVPVLLDGATMPREDQLPDDIKPLIRRNGADIRRSSFDSDTQRLISRLEVGKASMRRRMILLGGAGALAIMLIAGWLIVTSDPSSGARVPSFEPGPQTAGVSNIPDIAGRWAGWASGGPGLIDYAWSIEQRGSDVAGTITLKQNGRDVGAYEFAGTYDGDLLVFGGTRLIVANTQFCMARGVLRLTRPGVLDGRWGEYREIPGGCVSGEGDVHLKRQ